SYDCLGDLQRFVRVRRSDQRRTTCPNSLDNILELRAQRLFGLYFESHHLALGYRCQLLGHTIFSHVVLEERQLLRQIIDVEHAALTGQCQLANLGWRKPVHIELDERVVIETQQRRQHVFVIGVNAPSGFGVDPRWLRSKQVARDVDVVRGQIDHDADISNTSRKWPHASRVQAKHMTEIAAREPLVEGDNSWVESLQMPDGHPAAGTSRHVDQLPRFLAGSRDRLLNKHVGAGVHRSAGDHAVQTRGDGDYDEVEAFVREHPLVVEV